MDDSSLANRLIEPTVLLTFTSVLLYFVAFRYWQSYLSALNVNASWLDPSITRLFAFSLNGIAAALIFIAAYFGIDEIKRPSIFWPLAIVWIAGIFVLHGVPQTRISSQRFEWGNFLPALPVAFMPLIQRILHRHPWEPATVRALDARGQWVDEHLQTLKQRYRAPSLSKAEMSSIEHDASELEKEVGAIVAESRRIRRRYTAMIAAALLIVFSYTALPTIAKVQAFHDARTAQWYSTESIEAPLATDGSATVSLRLEEGICRIMLRTASGTIYLRACPREFVSDTWRARVLGVDWQEEQLRAAERDLRLSEVGVLRAKIRVGLQELKEIEARLKNPALLSADNGGGLWDAGVPLLDAAAPDVVLSSDAGTSRDGLDK